MRKMAVLTAMALFLLSCSDRQVSPDTGPATDGPPDKKIAPEGPVPDKKKNPTDAPQAKCPAKKPNDGAACTDNLLCYYLIKKCPCDPSSLKWQCACTSKTWKCSRNYDCNPCDGSVSDTFKTKDVSTCPPVPPCNWCGGTSIKDAKGCVIGFKCANGADPCKTQPCTSTSCKAGEYCRVKDLLCWPIPDGGLPKPDYGKVTCKGGLCSGSSSGDCGCEWTCSNGNTYKVDCKQTKPSAKDCKCLINGVQKSTCVYTAGGYTCSPAKLAQCCGFPV